MDVDHESIMLRVGQMIHVDHFVYKVTAGVNGFTFFRFPRVARFCDSDGRCRLTRWWMLAAHWLKNGVITYLSHGQGKQGV